MKLPHLLFLLIVGVALLALTMAPVHFVNSTFCPRRCFRAQNPSAPRRRCCFSSRMSVRWTAACTFIAHGYWQYDLLLSDSGMAFRKPKEGVGGTGQQTINDGTAAHSSFGSGVLERQKVASGKPAVMNY